MQGLQHRQDLLTDAVAIKAWIVVAWVLPDRQLQFLADGGRVVMAEMQQWSYELDLVCFRGIQGPLPTQAAKPGQVCSPAELQQQRFGSIAGGVSGHDCPTTIASSVEVELITGLTELGIAPFTGFGLAAGDAECAGADLQWQLLRPAPAGQFTGSALGRWIPAVVSMPELQGPVMLSAKVPQQPQQSHGVLAPGNRQQKCCPLGQQLGIA